MRKTKSALSGLPSTGRLKRLIKEAVSFRRLTLSMGAEGLSKPLLGKLGEYYVFLELMKYGVQTIEKSGHSRYDFLLPKVIGREEMHVEVRTSLPKNEGIYPKSIWFHGWRVETVREKHPLPFDIMICVALKKDFSEPQFYLFKKKELMQLQEVKISRYKNVKRKIHLFPDKNMLKKATIAKPEVISWFERHINNKRQKYQSRWGLVVPNTLFTPPLKT